MRCARHRPDHAGRASDVDDGLRLIRRIRGGWPDVRIVVLTSLTNAAILRSIMSDGVIGMLNKSESMDELAAAIRAAGAGRSYVSQSILRTLAEASASRLACRPCATCRRVSARSSTCSCAASQFPKSPVTSGGTSAQSAARNVSGCHRRTRGRARRARPQRFRRAPRSGVLAQQGIGAFSAIRRRIDARDRRTESRRGVEAAGRGRCRCTGRQRRGIDAALSRQYAGVLKIVGTVREPDTVGVAVRSDLAPLAGLIDRCRHRSGSVSARNG